MVRVLKKVAIAVGAVITTKTGGSAVDDGFSRKNRAVSGDDVTAECVFFPFLIMMVTMRLLLATV